MEEQLSLFEYVNKNDKGFDKVYISIDQIYEVYRNSLIDYFNEYKLSTNTDISASILMKNLQKYIDTRVVP